MSPLALHRPIDDEEREVSSFTGSRIDHLNLAVPDLTRSSAFYEPVLATIGIRRLLTVPGREIPEMHGYGSGEKPFFWLVANGRVGTNMHLAFTVGHRDDVHRFYDAALGAGASALQEPAVHPEYHPDYFGAFVLDPDGINLEAVCHEPPDPRLDEPERHATRSRSPQREDGQ